MLRPTTAGRSPQRPAAIDLILERRSVRAGYADEPLEAELLDTIVACGMAAPASKAAPPCRFHVVTDRPLLQVISAAAIASPGVEEYVPSDPVTARPREDWPSTVVESAEVLRSVPAAIFVENLGPFSGGRSTLCTVPREHLTDALVGYGFELLGVGAAIQNLWLAAEALGLGAVYMGDVVIAEREIRARLGMEGDLMGVLALGKLVDAGRAL